MNDYFDHVERSLREAMRRRRHLPWYQRLLARRSRPAVVAAVVLLGGGTALAATGVLQTGAPVRSEVQPTPYAGEGAVIASSLRVLPLRVPDPAGGPPWGLRVARTSRGLLCVQVGRVVGGRIGVLGRDGAFRDDGAFHPFSTGYLSGVGCGTEDGRGDAFVNDQLHGVPASGLLDSRRYTSGGCYAASTRATECPPTKLRDVYFGMLGPDATTVTEHTAGGATSVVATVAPYGAYLVVLPHTERRCSGATPACFSGRGYTFSPTLPPNEAIAAVSYRDARPCRLPAPAEIVRRRRESEQRLREALRRSHPDIYAKLYGRAGEGPGGFGALSPHQIAELQALGGPAQEASCPDLGYVAPKGPRRELTSSQLASPVTLHLERARRYCERGETVIACEGPVPRGYKRLTMVGPPEFLLVVDFTARQAVRNFDSHYEIETSIPQEPRRPGFQEGCGGTFGPTQANLRAGQHVSYTTFMNARCHGITHITVGYVTVNGPSGATPVPGLPGQNAAIPVGEATLRLP